MKKHMVYHIIVLIVLLTLLNIIYAALYSPGDAHYRESILKINHERIVFNISKEIDNRRSTDIKFSELQPDDYFDRVNDYKDIEKNTLVSSYFIYVPIVPGFILTDRKRIIETKFYIDKEGFIIVYSYFLPQMKDNVLVTTNKIDEKTNRGVNIGRLYEQKYMTESELIALLNEKGFVINKLCFDVPTDVKGISRQEPIMLRYVMIRLILISLILSSVFISSVLIYKKRKYSYSLLLLSAILTMFSSFCFGYDLVWYLIGAFILSFIVLTVLILRCQSGQATT
jgi:hypothetical protein